MPIPSLDDVAARLRASGSVFAEEEAELLIAEAPDAAELERMIGDRVLGLPLEQIVGWAEFRGLRIAVEPGVFVPRRRTEALVSLAAELVSDGSVVVELCCGVAAVATALAAEHPGLELWASDIDPVAVHSATRNLGSAGTAIVGDLFDGLPDSLRGRVDVVVANAPYVPTDDIRLMPPEAREHEPLTTLDGGPDGVDIQRRITAAASEWLAPGGHLLIETSRRQAPLTLAAFQSAGFVARVERDDDVDGTVVVGTVVVGARA